MDKTIKGQERKSKLVFSLDSPYSAVEWPSISHHDQETILELLCSLISPIGQHRALLAPSKGKRSRKRKRPTAATTTTTAATESQFDLPCPPEIAAYITLGLNATTARLESLASSTRPSSLPAPLPLPQEKTGSQKQASVRTGASSNRLRAVFVCRSDSQPSQLHAHVPLLCGLASRPVRNNEGEPEDVEKSVKLIQLPKGSDTRLSTALGISRTGFLGLMDDAPGATAILDFIDKNVSDITIPWMPKNGETSYLPTAVKVLKSTAPAAGREGGGKSERKS